MNHCMTTMQKFYAIVWAIIGLFAMCLFVAANASFWGVVTPNFSDANEDMINICGWAVFTAGYVAITLTQRHKFEFVEKMYQCVLMAGGDKRADHRVVRWVAELQMRDAWADWIACTNCSANIENIAEFLDSTFGIQLGDLSAWRKAGTSRKNLSNKQVKDVLRVVSERVEIIY